MYTSYDPLPNSNSQTDKVRASNFHGAVLFTNAGAYYANIEGSAFYHKDGLKIPATLVDKCVEGAANGHQIYLRLSFTVSPSNPSPVGVRWADPEEIAELPLQDDHYVVTPKDFVTLDPWDEDLLLAKGQKGSSKGAGQKPAVGLGAQILDFLQKNPGRTNNHISEALGKDANTTSGMLSMLFKQGAVRRERETEDNRSGERLALRYWVA